MSDLYRAEHEPEQECIHGLGPISACTICNGRDAEETAAARAAHDRIEYRFTANWSSVVNCGHFVAVGEQLARLGDETVVCEECAS